MQSRIFDRPWLVLKTSRVPLLPLVSAEQVFEKHLSVCFDNLLSYSVHIIHCGCVCSRLMSVEKLDDANSTCVIISRFMLLLVILHVPGAPKKYPPKEFC